MGTPSEHEEGMPGPDRRRRTPFELLCRFFFSALMGGLVSLALAGVCFWCYLFEAFTTGWKHLFWIIPLAWGLLGMAGFDVMLALGGDILARLLGGFDPEMSGRRRRR